MIRINPNSGLKTTAKRITICFITKTSRADIVCRILKNMSPIVLIKIISYGLEIKDDTVENVEEKIFERGYRSPQAREKSDGTGYGLWLSRKLVRFHGDQFDLYFERNENLRNVNTFVIQIPKEKVR